MLATVFKAYRYAEEPLPRTLVRPPIVLFHGIAPRVALGGRPRSGIVWWVMVQQWVPGVGYVTDAELALDFDHASIRLYGNNGAAMPLRSIVIEGEGIGAAACGGHIAACA